MTKDNMANVWLFFVPMHYNFSIRLQRYDKVLSWLFINIFPTFFYALCSVEQLTMRHVLAVTLLWLGVFFLYEFGYIYNDVYAVAYEKTPTLRLNSKQVLFAKKHIWAICIVRFFIFVVCLCGLWWLFPTHNVLMTIGLACVCPLLFYIYNRWRNTKNIWIYCWLVASRFIPFACLFTSADRGLLMLLIVIVYPLPISIERFSMSRYGFRLMMRLIPDMKAQALFRIGYYVVVSMVLTIFMSVTCEQFLYLVPLYVFAIYRLAVYCLLNLK